MVERKKGLERHRVMDLPCANCGHVRGCTFTEPHGDGPFVFYKDAVQVDQTALMEEIQGLKDTVEELRLMVGYLKYDLTNR